MKKIKINNIQYEIIVASDVDRDGLGIELWDRTNSTLLLEIFRHDDKRIITFSSNAKDLPLHLLEDFLQEYEKSIGRNFIDITDLTE
jgi:hypothetical protein